MELTGNGNASIDNAPNGAVQEGSNGAADSSKTSLIPPYWSHRRYESYASIENTKPAPITLEDHTEDLGEHTASCWAKGVSIDSYVIIDGTVPNVGRFVVWHCKIDTLDVSLLPHNLVHVYPPLGYVLSILMWSRRGVQ